MSSGSQALAERAPGVVLGGFMGAGKSTVGRSLAARLGLPFVDTDRVLGARFGPIPEQLARDGEAVFRTREARVVRELCDGVPRVVATGGGVFADAGLREQLRATYVLVTLRAPLAVLRERVGRGEGRPLWGEGAAALLERRTPGYEDVDHVVDVAGLDVDAVVAEVLACVRA
jgi:shikimate kinase